MLLHTSVLDSTEEGILWKITNIDHLALKSDLEELNSVQKFWEYLNQCILLFVNR